MKTLPKYLTSHNAQHNYNARIVKANDIFEIGYKRFQLNSVASYAVENNDCPIKAIQRATDNGHQLVFAVPLAAMIASTPVDRHVDFNATYGEIIYFQGRIFTIEKANNDNIMLVEIDY